MKEKELTFDQKLQLMHFRRLKNQDRIKFFKALWKGSNDIGKIILIGIKIFVYLLISISAGLGVSPIAQWLNFGMLSNEYLYYLSYIFTALSFWILMEMQK